MLHQYQLQGFEMVRMVEKQRMRFHDHIKATNVVILTVLMSLKLYLMVNWLLKNLLDSFNFQEWGLVSMLQELFFQQQSYILCGMSYKAVVMEMLLIRETIGCVLWKLQTVSVYKHLVWMSCNWWLRYYLDSSLHYPWILCYHSDMCRDLSLYICLDITLEILVVFKDHNEEVNWNILNYSVVYVLSKK